MADPQKTQELADILQRMIAFYRGMGPSCDNTSTYEEVSTIELEDRLKTTPGAKVLDVRTADEYGEGHIPGALFMPFTEIPQKYDALPPRETPLFVSCAQGVRSRVACNLLAHLGYSKLFNVTEGMNAWNGPVEQGSGQ